MNVVWSNTQLIALIGIEDAKLLLTWLESFGPMAPGSIQETLRTRLVDSYPQWSKFLKGLSNIPYRGSVTDLATDVAFELQASQARVLIDELERFLLAEPGKFKP